MTSHGGEQGTGEVRPRWSLVGPGLVVAGTGVGAGALYRVPREWRNGVLGNVVLSICAVMFLAVGANELYKAVTGVF